MLLNSWRGWGNGRGTLSYYSFVYVHVFGFGWARKDFDEVRGSIVAGVLVQLGYGRAEFIVFRHRSLYDGVSLRSCAEPLASPISELQ